MRRTQPTAAEDERGRELEEQAERALDEAELLRQLRARRNIERSPVYKGAIAVAVAQEEDCAARIADLTLSADARAVVNGSFTAIRAFRLNLLDLLVQNALAAQPRPVPEGVHDEGTPARETGEPDLV